MPQKIGLESTLEGKAFQRGVSEYLGGLNKMQSETANVGSSINSTLSKIGSAATGSVGGLGKLASSLGGVATVAGGIVAANLFNKMAEGIGAFVSTGLQAVDSAQRLETGLGALLSMNNMYQRQTETLTVATKSAKEWADELTNAADKSDDLAFRQRELTADINTQNASIQEQRQRIIQMADGLDKNQQVARLAEMEIALEGMQRELAKTGEELGGLSNIQQEYTTTTRTSFEQVMGLADAQKLAAAQSKDLLAYVEKLAIVSPFESDQVGMVTKLAIAAGLGVEQTKSFTAGFLDLAAAVGIGSESLDFAADQLLQVAKVGKITSVDLRQLRRLGIDLEKIIGTQMGMSIEEFNEKAAKSPDIFNELFDSVTKFSQNTFAGTAEKMATSLSGLKSTFSDIFKVGAKNMLRPLVEAVGPMASDMLGRLSGFVTGPEMAKIGESIPKILFGAFQSLSGEGEGQFFSGLKGLGLDSSTAKGITDITKKLRDFYEEAQFIGLKIQYLFSSIFSSDLMSNMRVSVQGWDLLTSLGLSSETAHTITDVIISIKEFAAEAMRLKDVFMSGFGEGGLGGGIAALFGDIKPQLENLAGQFLAGLPTFFSSLTTGLTSFLQTNTPPFMDALNTWGPMFWDGLRQAIMGAATGAVAVGIAITAWISSPDAQAQLMQAGNTLGQALWQGLTFLVQNSDQAAQVVMMLTQGLAVAAVGVTAMLVAVGAQIVAGIMQGIAESLGVDLQPAMIGELSAILSGIGSDLSIIAGYVGEQISEGIQTGLKNAWAGAKANILNALLPGFAGLGAAILPYLEEVFTTAEDVFDPGKWMELGASLMEGLLKGIQENSAQVLEFLKNLAYDSLASLKGIWLSSSPSRAFAEEGKNAVDGLVKGAMDNAAQVPRTFSGLGQSAINSLMTGMKVTDAGFIHDFIDDLNMGGIGKAAGAGGGQWKNFRNILKNEITANMQGLADGSIDFMDKITDVANRFHFPPNLAREFAEVEGLVEHLTGTFGVMFQKMRIENMKESLGLASQFAGIGQSFADMLKEEMAGGEEVKNLSESTLKLTEQNTQLTDSLSDQQKKMDILKAELASLVGEENQNIIAIDKKKLAIEELNEAMEKNRQKLLENEAAIVANRQARDELATSSKAGLFAALEEFLKGNEQTFRMFKAFEDGTTSEFFWDRNQAQEEFNKLLTEQKAEQEKILALEKAQKDLAFLQQQVSLLDMISSRDLNPAEILGGITLGLEASASDLLAVTGNIVQAMVNQINQDLQIHSPSRVMRGIGEKIGQGLALGVEASKGLVQGAIAKMPVLGGSQMVNSQNRTSSMTVNMYGVGNRRTVGDIMMLKGRTSGI